MIMGQAAGAAASLAVREKVALQDANVQALQKMPTQCGAILQMP